MKRIIAFFALILSTHFAIGQDGSGMTYYWSSLVQSIEGSRSYEKRSSPDLFPLTAWIEIDSNSLKNDSIAMRIHLVSISDSSSRFFMSTLFLSSRSSLNDNRRDVYLVDKYILELSARPTVSDWIKVHRSGGIMITQSTACSTRVNVGIFPVME